MCCNSRNLEAAEFRSSAEPWVAEVPELSDSLLESSSTHTWAGEHTLTHTPSAPQLWLSSSIPSSGSSSISSITDTTLTVHVSSNLLQLIDDPRIFTTSVSLLFVLLWIRNEMRHGLPLYGGCVNTTALSQNKSPRSIEIFFFNYFYLKDLRKYWLCSIITR